MIKVTYEFHCDICNEKIKNDEKVTCPATLLLAQPYAPVTFGMHLCESCCSPILDAVKDTRKKRSPC